MKHLPRILMVVVLGFALMFASVGLAQAPAPQSAPPAAPVSTPGGGSGYITRSLYTEIALTVIVFGLALFAVCRNSNRS